MAVQFLHVPSYSSEVKVKPRLRVVRFGDGYIQRAADGINIHPKIYDLRFQNITKAKADLIEADLIAAAGGTIQWKLPPAADLDPFLNWVCLDGWSRQKTDSDTETLSCQFEQVFE